MSLEDPLIDKNDAQTAAIPFSYQDIFSSFIKYAGNDKSENLSVPRLEGIAGIADQTEDPLLDEDEYQAFVRALQWLDGFGIYFAVCTPIQAERLIKRVETDIPHQNIASLVLEEAIDNLYLHIEKLIEAKPADIIFIQGLEKSLVEYIKSGYGGRGDYYKEDSVPRILGHLNLQRERYRDRFKSTRFVFLLPLFALRYFMLRAPDFFDWRSGIFEFSTEENIIKQEITKILEKDSESYKNLTEKERHQRILEIQALIEESQADQDKIKLYHEHIALLGLNNMYEEAIVSCNKILKVNENDIVALEKNAYFLHILGRMEESLEKIDQALKYNPNKASLWILRSIILLNLKRTNDAINCATKLTQLKPKDAFSWWFNSFILSATEKYQDALTSLNQAKKIDSRNPSIWEMRGNVYGALKKYKEALKSYDKAIKFGNSDFEILLKKSFTLLKLKRYYFAIASCNQAIQLEPDNWLIWAIRADAFVGLEKYEDALIDYNNAIQQKPTHAELWHNKGNILANLKRYKEALQSYDKALSFSSDDKATLSARSLILIELERPKEAIESLDKLARISKKENKFWLDYVEYLIQKSSDSDDELIIADNTGNFYSSGSLININKNYIEAAILVLGNIYENNINNPEFYYISSRVKYRIDQNASALDDINKAIKLEDNINYYGLRGAILKYLNRYQEALLDFEKIVKSYPKVYRFWENIGDCEFALGDYSEALNSYKKAIFLKKDNIDLYLKCIRIEFNYNIRSALVNLNKAVRLDPNNYQVWLLYGMVKGELRKPKDIVLKDLDKAIQLCSDKNIALLQTSKILFNLSYAEEAERYCNKAIAGYSTIIENNPNNELALYNRASCYAFLKNAQLAISDLKNAIKLNSDWVIEAKNDEDFDSIKANPDFQVLLNSCEITKLNITEFKKKFLISQPEQIDDPLLGSLSQRM